MILLGEVTGPATWSCRLMQGPLGRAPATSWAEPGLLLGSHDSSMGGFQSYLCRLVGIQPVRCG